MAIITISRGSYSKGREVAERVAKRLDYQCIAREVLLEASEQFNIPEIKLIRAIHDAPSILDQFTYGKEKYVAYVKAAFLKRVQRDNVVYHGLAGHFFLKGVAHTLKVRIIAGMEDRVRLEMTATGASWEQALQTIKKDDEERRKWSLNLYGIDTSDPNLYDLVIHLRKITIEDAVDIICHTAGMATFKTTFESQKAMDDLALAAEVRAALIELKPDIQVHAKDGNVIIGTKTSLLQEQQLTTEIQAIAGKINGVKSVELKLTHRVEWTE